MGWDFGWETRKDMIRHITKPFIGEGGKSYKTIKSKSRGSSVLWSVCQADNKLFIGCYLTKKNQYGWGYKAMSESVEPFCYSCPLEFLNMVPVTCQEWRDRVKEYHAKRNRKVEVGQRIALKESTIPFVDIISTRPLIGVYLSTQYRIPKKMMGNLVTA